jgi:dGTPase
LEVSQIARSICRALSLNEDLGEALALAHDLGHPPFGHAGEDALKEVMRPFGGFDHNAQSLSVVVKLEERYANFNGLNLTWETLEGLVKHNGPLLTKLDDNLSLPRAISEYAKIQDLKLDTYSSAEAQAAALADDIAYNNHDIDDGLRAELFTIKNLNDVPLVGRIFFQVRKDYPDIDQSRHIHEAVRRLIGEMTSDLLNESTRRIKDTGIKSVDDVRELDHPLICFSEKMSKQEAYVKAFLFENMYRHDKLNIMTDKARKVVRELFGFFIKNPELLPVKWRQKYESSDKKTSGQVVADYVAGMTDRFALNEHHRLIEPHL